MTQPEAGEQRQILLPSRRGQKRLLQRGPACCLDRQANNTERKPCNYQPTVFHRERAHHPGTENDAVLWRKYEVDESLCVTPAHGSQARATPIEILHQIWITQNLDDSGIRGVVAIFA